MGATIKVAIAAAVAVLSGCSSTSLSGIGGESSFSCAAPEGVSCMSVTGININATKKTLPAMRRTPEDEAAGLARKDKPLRTVFGAPDESGERGFSAGVSGEEPTRGTRPRGDQVATAGPPAGMVSPAQMETPFSGQPIRSAPKILRIWMAPFEDNEQDLHDQRYLYVTVNQGRWLIEANQASIQRGFRPVFQLGRRGGGDAAADDDSTKAGAKNAAQEAAGSMGPAVGPGDAQRRQGGPR